MTLRFRLALTHKQVTGATADGLTIVLQPIPWDDFGYKCTFELVLIRESGKHIALGEWKIVDTAAKSKGRTEVPLSFESLPDSFLSLGQTREAYKQLRALPATSRGAFLEG